MSIWGKVIGGAAGFAIGGPLGALLGTLAGHAIDKQLPSNNSKHEAHKSIAFTAGVIALSICDSPFIAEIFRSGIEAVPKGQKEAGSSLGLNKYQKFTLITLPQAIKIILPALGNQFIYMIKMSSLVSIIGLNELTRKANELVVSQYRPLEIYTFLVLEYLVLILIISYFVRKLEKKLRN